MSQAEKKYKRSVCGANCLKPLLKPKVAVAASSRCSFNLLYFLSPPSKHRMFPIIINRYAFAIQRIYKI